MLLTKTNYEDDQMLLKTKDQGDQMLLKTKDEEDRMLKTKIRRPVQWAMQHETLKFVQVMFIYR